MRFVAPQNYSKSAVRSQHVTVSGFSCHQKANRGCFFGTKLPQLRYYSTPEAVIHTNETIPKGHRVKDLPQNFASHLNYPLRVVGAASERRRIYWAWDANISGIRDILNPSVFFTFKDDKGRLLRKVRYESFLLSWGLKLEMSLRLQIGILFGKCKEKEFLEIPKRIKVEGGWDIGLLFCSVSWIKLKQPSNATLLFFGIGTGTCIGATQIDAEESYLELNDFEDCEFLDNTKT